MTSFRVPSGERRLPAVRRFAIRVLVGLGLAALAACSDPTGSGKSPHAPAAITALPRSLTSTEQTMVSASTTFGFDLLRQLSDSAPGDNIFISPLSVSMALGMTMDGAEGSTFSELRAALGFSNESHDELNGAYASLITLLSGLDPLVDFRIANAIFYRISFAPSIAAGFTSDARQFFDAQVQALDFSNPSAADTVNAWASTHTNGKIPKVIDPGTMADSSLVMLLANAIYFKGDWRGQFNPAETSNQPFAQLSGSSASVPMMHRKGGFRVGTAAHATVIEFPYGGDAFSMTVLLPDSGTSVNTVLGELSAATWQSATRNLHENDELEVYLPKFTLSWKAELIPALEHLGVHAAFDPRSADFTRLSPSQGHELVVGFVRHNSYVDVNEVGTEAAAVTTVGVNITAYLEPVRVNRPFVFAIRERLSGTILFLGKITTLPVSQN